MAYQLLTQDEQDDITVAFMLSQERDKYCHEVNKARYVTMLSALEDGDFKVRITKLHAETAGRLAEVNSIIAATVPEMPTQARIDASMVRIAAKAVATSGGVAGGGA